MKGYTLIEILVALTIIGLLFSFGYVNFRDYARRQSVSGAAKQIQGDIRLMQGQASAGQKPDNVKCKTPNTLDGYGLKVDSSSQYTIEAECSGGSVSIKEVAMASDIILAIPSPNPIVIKVLGQGTNIGNGQNAVINLTQVGTSNATTVTVTAGGEIK